VLAAAARENAEAIAELKACRGADTWPARYEALRPLTLAATT
jgi:hypothetical protein